MKTNIKYCKITGKELDPETQKKSGNGLFISTAVRTLYKQCNKDVEKTKEMLKDYFWVEETRAYYPNWMSCARALSMANISMDQQKEIYNREFLSSTKCQLEICDKNVPYEMREKTACCITHYNQAYAIKTNKFDISDYNCECLECGMKFANNIALGIHISQNHYSSEEYYIKFHKKPEDGFCKWCKTPTGFNSIQEGYNKFCYNTSCNVNYYNKYENRHECGESISKSLILSQNMPNQIGYWTKKGYTEEQAKALVSERQKTNTIESILKREKCDIHTATEKRKEITRKWLESFPKQNYSNVSQELFWKIYDIIKNDYKEIHFATILNGNKVSDGTNNEFKIKTDKTIRSLDFYVKDVNKVIEFNGSYWHSSASKNVNYSIERDIQRNEEVMKALNCDLLIVDELDYYKDKNKIVEKCIEFIKNEN
jgi:hypothetical protein